MFANYSLESGYTRLDSVFSALLIIIIVLIPVLTMRTISEEKRTKTDQCLLTAPVGLGSIVVGKFLCRFPYLYHSYRYHRRFLQLSYPLSVRLTGTSLWAISSLWHLLAALISLSVSSAHLSQKTR